MGAYDTRNFCVRGVHNLHKQKIFTSPSGLAWPPSILVDRLFIEAHLDAKIFERNYPIIFKYVMNGPMLGAVRKLRYHIRVLSWSAK